MIRLFVAVELPEDIRLQLEGMGRSIPGSRPVNPEQLHLSLRFIGEVEGSIALDIETALENTDMHRFQAALKGVGIFPHRGQARVLWAGISAVEEITRLRNQVEKQLVAIGLPREKKKYSPHITLARLKNSPGNSLQQFLAANAFLDSGSFSIDSFTLFSSRLTAKGAIHTPIRIYQLPATRGRSS